MFPFVSVVCPKSKREIIEVNDSDEEAEDSAMSGARPNLSRASDWALFSDEDMQNSGIWRDLNEFIGGANLRTARPRPPWSESASSSAGAASSSAGAASSNAGVASYSAGAASWPASNASVVNPLANTSRLPIDNSGPNQLWVSLSVKDPTTGSYDCLKHWHTWPGDIALEADDKCSNRFGHVLKIYVEENPPRIYVCFEERASANMCYVALDGYNFKFGRADCIISARLLHTNDLPQRCRPFVVKPPKPARGRKRMKTESGDWQ